MNSVLAVRRKSRRISLTALIDVVFILLMFFMLTSSFSRFGYFEFQTQGAGGGGTGDAQVLLLQADGELLDRSVSPAQVMSDERLLARMDASRPLSLLPAGDADVQTMVQAIERLNRIGLSRVTLGQVLSAEVD
ncbi:ExbD/TolR family protein [Granulosicoccus sp. 3-233]|uniref:ExbD/TolR family protein n=1 Tax=Granulosicoccus sp. 3-233 TaxID=3417969 RepID=UPI003D329DE9